MATRAKIGLLVWLGLIIGHSAQAQQPGPNVLDWKAQTTLSTYLFQQLHAQYAPRAAELDRAAQSAAGATAYRDSVRARFRRVLGPLPSRTPLQAQVTGKLQRPGFQIEKIIYESTPKHHVTANLYVPAGKGKKPGVLLFCGHEQESKATVSYQKTAILLAQHGFVVLVIDPISQGERMQLTDAAGKALTRGGTTEHTLLNADATLLGQTTPGEEFWDNARSLDYLLTRPEIDTARLGCLGNSGGATQTAYFMALEPRMKVAALCSYVASGEKNLELTGPADGCVQLPGAGRARLDIADWPIMFAPKPLLVLAGRYDFVDYTQIEAATTETRRIYRALGKPEQLDLFTYDDGHGISQPKREVAVAWFRRWFYGDAAPVREGNLPVSTTKELQCTATGQVNTAFRDEVALAAQHLAEAQKLATRRPATAAEIVAAVRQQQRGYTSAITSDGQPARVEIRPLDTLRRAGLTLQKFVLRRPGEPPLPLLLALPSGLARPTKVLIWLADGGKAAVLDSSAAQVQANLRQGTAVVLADLRGLGETADPSAAIDPKYYNREYRNALLALHEGRPLPLQRAADIDILQVFVRNADPLAGAPVELRASGRAVVPALQVSLLGPDITRLTVDKMPPSYQELLTQPAGKNVYSEVLPGVLRHYDLLDLQRVLGERLVVGKTP
ncbi:acetylxylan esterase [Microvirga sp. STS02]|uniref:alpha/beta hydrolase family protein n=1 Tax=Hymenobacter negativus TaxID=2795026 RepID=UPI0018DE1966|nr:MULTISPECIES: acetylxylan esterase [Bacteria]MBH8569872.1 acetylxylan esterase [Hymenobacter negativus]MBR7209611.1 acetylxylan esterase [Microvirga sp. STS02]